MSNELNANIMARKTLKWILNFLIWFFIIPALIDLYLYITGNKLITDSLFGAKRSGKDHLTYFGFYALFAISWMLFGITLIANMVYIALNGQSYIEKLASTKTTFGK